ncbi:MAG TPA: hypothetical protein VHO29_11650 [Marmoricola sp.]|nr:hypothetical protein [Marmoricola sp.]
MTTVPRRSHHEHRVQAGRVPHPRRSTDAPVTRADDTGEPDPRTAALGDRPRPTVPEPSLVRAGVSAVVGMVLLAALLGAVGGIALLWLGTQMLVYLR